MATTMTVLSTGVKGLGYSAFLVSKLISAPALQQAEEDDGD
jgi:hypothetical protein